MKPQEISYHIDDIMLWDYAKGNLSSGERLVVKTHIELCPKCAEKAQEFMALCGEMLSEVDGIELCDGAFETILARLDGELEAKIASNAVVKKQIYGFDLPKALWDVIIKERYFIAPGIWIAPIFESVSAKVAKSYLLFVKRGMSLLKHSHSGREINLVLSGGFSDGEKEFGVGDFVIEDEKTIHAPNLYEDEDCLTLVYQDGPILPLELLGHLIKPIARI